jgi:hypothetical protein
VSVVVRERVIDCNARGVPGVANAFRDLGDPDRHIEVHAWLEAVLGRPVSALRVEYDVVDLPLVRVMEWELDGDGALVLDGRGWPATRCVVVPVRVPLPAWWQPS